jgi:hypothetical protein
MTTTRPRRHAASNARRATRPAGARTARTRGPTLAASRARTGSPRHCRSHSSHPRDSYHARRSAARRRAPPAAASRASRVGRARRAAGRP